MGLNHIFKVIWSKSKNAWVVVSELAYNTGKTKTVRVASKGLLAVAVISALGGGAASAASADYDSTTRSIYIGDVTPRPMFTEVVRIGTGGYVGGSNTVAIGNAHAGSDNAIAIGSSARAGHLSSANPANDGAIAIGNSARSWDSSTGIAIGSSALASAGESSIAIGVSAYTFASNDSIALGNRAFISNGGKNRIAIGTSSYNDADDSIAIGGGTLADGERGVVIGAAARASGESSTALGAGANTDSIANSVALGSNSMSSAYVQPTDATINGVQLKSSSFAGVNSSNSTVSVGYSAINMQRQIKNVAAGVVSATSTDAINGSQLYAAIDAITKAGTGTGTGGATTLNVAGDNGSTSSVNLGTQSFNITGTDGVVTNASGNGITIGLDVATQAKINNATSNGADKDLSNITTTGEQKIKDTAAWNVQVNSNAAEKVEGGDTVAFKEGKNISITNTGKDITIATASTVDFDKVTVGGATGGVTIDGASKKIGGLNDATANDEAVNLGQVKALINTSTVGTSSINYKVNGGATQATSLVDGFDFNGDNNIQIAADPATTGKLNYSLNSNLTGIQSIGGGTGTGPTITFNNSVGGTPSIGVNSTIDMANNKITNLQDGTVAAGSKEAVNGGQLFDVKATLENNLANKDLSNITTTGEQKIKDTAAWNVQVNSNAAEKVQGGDTVAFKDGKNISITNTGKDITIATASTVDFDKVTVGGTTGGVTIDGTSKTIGGLNNATTNDQAVNLGQVKALINTSTVGTSSINYKVNSGAAQATSLVDGFDFAGDTNIQIAADTATTGKINYTLNPNLTGIQSIGGGTSAGNGPTITFNNPTGGTLSVGVNSTLDMGGNKITNLQDGTIAAGSKDAVNGGQLFDVKTDLENKINTISTASPAGLNHRIDKLSDRIDKVGAGSAALAALHPLDFHPDDKWTVSAGYGHYRGASAGAVGAFYRPNEDTLFSISGTLGNGDTQMNAGVNFRIGKKSPTSRTTVAMGREMAEMNARMQELESSNKELRRALTMLLDPSKAVEFPDVPKDHWAYQYISQLAGNGIITGYPDGTFKGDKTMTRYEVATIIYRALQNGAPMDANMERAVTEFAPELQNIRMKHFRVDRIAGDDNARQKVERVRVNNENTSNSDVYGSRIVK